MKISLVPALTAAVRNTDTLLFSPALTGATPMNLPTVGLAGLRFGGRVHDQIADLGSSAATKFWHRTLSDIGLSFIPGMEAETGS